MPWVVIGLISTCHYFKYRELCEDNELYYAHLAGKRYAQAILSAMLSSKTSHNHKEHLDETSIRK